MIVRLTSGSPTYPTSEENGLSGVPSRSKPALQNADTAWNTPIFTPRQKPNCGTKRQESSTAPAASNAKVPNSTRRVSRTMPALSDRLSPALITSRSRSVIVRRSRKEAIDASVIKPSPPIWMSSRIIACPKPDQCVAVPTVTRPVTQVAEVAVNSASRNAVGAPLRDETGRVSSSAPVRIMIRKPSAITMLACIGRCTRRRNRFVWRITVFSPYAICQKPER